MSHRSKLLFLSALLLLALGSASIVLWRQHTAEPSLAELHEQHPWAAGDFAGESPWLTIEDVQFSNEGTVTIRAMVHRDANTGIIQPSGMQPHVLAFSPGGRTWGGDTLEVSPGTQATITYRFFEYSLAEPEPVKGYYCLVLAAPGNRVNHVFVNFVTGDWKAD